MRCPATASTAPMSGPAGGVCARERLLRGVIHFAAFKAVGESVQKPLAYYHNNVGSLLALLKVMQRVRGRRNLVFSSSCTVYGIPDKLPVTEETPTKPALRLTAAPSRSAKTSCATWRLRRTATCAPFCCATSTLLAPTLRPKSASCRWACPTTWCLSSPRQPLASGRSLPFSATTYDTPDGTNIRDYIHVVDLAKAHVVAVQRLLKGKATKLLKL